MKSLCNTLLYTCYLYVDIINFEQFSKCYNCILFCPIYLYVYGASLNKSLVLSYEYYSITQSTILSNIKENNIFLNSHQFSLQNHCYFFGFFLIFELLVLNENTHFMISICSYKSMKDTCSKDPVCYIFIYSITFTNDIFIFSRHSELPVLILVFLVPLPIG